MPITTTDVPPVRALLLSVPAIEALETIQRVRAATAHQLIAHLWTEAPMPRTARAGYLILAKLKARGILRTLPLEPERGAVSREVLHLPEEDGTATTGGRRRVPDLSGPQLDALLQTTEVLLVRERQGWHVVSLDETALAFRQAALNVWRAGAMTDEERALEALLRQRRELPVLGRLLARGEGSTLEARVVLAVWTRDDAERIAEGLPLHRVRTLEIELVTFDPELAARAVAVLQRAADGAGRPITVWRIAPYWDRPNPALSQDPIAAHEVRLSPALRPATPERPRHQPEALIADLPLFSGEPAPPPLPNRAARRPLLNGHGGRRQRSAIRSRRTTVRSASGWRCASQAGR